MCLFTGSSQGHDHPQVKRPVRYRRTVPRDCPIRQGERRGAIQQYPLGGADCGQYGLQAVQGARVGE